MAAVSLLQRGIRLAGAALLVFVASGQARPPAAQPPRVGTGPGAPRPQVRPVGARPPAAPARSDQPSPAAVQVYRAACVDCHDYDGRGGCLREQDPSVPDFTDPKWHAAHTNSDMIRVIRDGKGKGMPSMKRKLGVLPEHELVTLLRAFEGGRLVLEEEDDPPATAAAPAAPPPDLARLVVPASPPASPAHHAAPPPAQPAADPQRDLIMREALPLYQRMCVRCHGRDGRGQPMRPRAPAIPDFADAHWQQRRTDAQLLVSVLDGKGDAMPPLRGKIDDRQARSLVALVRAFGPLAQRPAASGAASKDSFQTRFEQLQKEYDALNKQFHAVSSDPGRP